MTIVPLLLGVEQGKEGKWVCGEEFGERKRKKIREWTKRVFQKLRRWKKRLYIILSFFFSFLGFDTWF